MWIIKKFSQQIYRLFDTDGELVSEFNTFGNAKDYAIRAGYATIFDLQICLPGLETGAQSFDIPQITVLEEHVPRELE